ncbi:S41 family peptidase [Gilvimarinus agarilyticus]|uniref:S41 family peptidase n=1 Tax=Reichenbachiella agariperforans TaxID=156994 RepID=UPI001C08C2B6|nr:S41 family peptidase [Reichenbachiella agariperforans]MBU2885903.1 S41 family peptidase [Gilvimarinus agarilyticus]MBU2915286.1 S41 family peptidase [Reichenbachiella agariperforans]
MKRIIIGTVGVAVLVGMFSFTFYSDNYFEISRNLNIFATLYRELNTHYVDQLPNEEIVTTGIDAMLSSLDPYTDYIPESELESYRTITTGEYGGIGAIVGKRDGVNTVLMPYIGYPAHDAGLLIGDQITHIDGKSLKGLSSPAISELLKGQPGTELSLIVDRYGVSEPMLITIVREKITISNVAYYGMLQEDTGYILLSDFTTHASEETKNALLDLKARGAKKVVLDLRDNPGGLLDEAIKVANVFIPKGKEVVNTKGKKESWNKTYNAPNLSTDEEIPLVVLTSSGTASAAEIVSGVIQDYDRGVLVGKRTYGKGLVQATRPLPYNAQLKITTAKYYIPSGRCIQAIDYSHKNEDGSVAKIPDSLKVAFKTSKGRTVYDGGGINPDVQVDAQKYSHLLFNIISNDFLFDYATIYHAENAEISSSRSFELSDAEYAEFVTWLEAKDLSFSSQIDEAINRLVDLSKEEKYYEGLQPSIEALKEKVSKIKSSYLVDYQDEVKYMLEEEIVSRYYFQDGLIEAALDHDPTILRAQELLNSPAQYKQILSN